MLSFLSLSLFIWRFRRFFFPPAQTVGAQDCFYHGGRFQAQKTHKRSPKSFQALTSTARVKMWDIVPRRSQFFNTFQTSINLPHCHNSHVKTVNACTEGIGESQIILLPFHCRSFQSIWVLLQYTVAVRAGREWQVLENSTCSSFVLLIAFNILNEKTRFIYWYFVFMLGDINYLSEGLWAYCIPI